LTCAVRHFQVAFAEGVSGADLGSTEQECLEANALPDIVLTLLRDMGGREHDGGFVNYVTGCRAALRSSQKSFTARVYGEDVSFLARSYVETSSLLLQRFWQSVIVTESTRGDLEKLLRTYGLDQAYTAPGSERQAKL
jgi:hypothetical protein